MHLFVEVQNCVEFQFLKYLSFQGIGGVQTNHCDWYYGMVAMRAIPSYLEHVRMWVAYSCILDYIKKVMRFAWVV